MNRVGKFEKVSFNQFLNDWKKCFSDLDYKSIEAIYDNIKLPQRTTSGSAGYDFFSPCQLYINHDENINIPTGIRVNIEDGWVLMCYPRSGLGFKYGVELNNTVGVIDSDYYYAKNEGHIHAKIVNKGVERELVDIAEGQGFMQGIFTQYGITIDDNVNNKRTGGFGSTDNR